VLTSVLEETIIKQTRRIKTQTEQIKFYEKKLRGAETHELRVKLSCVSHRAAY